MIISADICSSASGRSLCLDLAAMEFPVTTQKLAVSIYFAGLYKEYYGK
jgi:hypothetical protein